jgi:protein-S-isoprenylcysteine O-methyltransferase Ste14
MENKIMPVQMKEKRLHCQNENLTGEHPRGDLGQNIGLIVFLLCWTLDSFVLHATTFLARFVPLAARLAGCGLLLVLAVYFALKGHRAVFGSPDSSRTVIREGLFARVRHPLYFGSLLFYLALCLASLSLVSFAIFFALLIFYDRIAAYEERLLVARFGPEYKDYQRKVHRWLPRLKPVRFDD